MKTSCRLGLFLTVISLFTLMSSGVLAFDIDGFKTGMNRSQIEERLKGMGFKDFIDGHESILTAERGRTNYAFSFNNDLLYKIEIYIEPSLRNFMFWFREFSNSYGRLLDSLVKREVSNTAIGEMNMAHFVWKTQTDLVSITYDTFSDLEHLTLRYESSPR